MYNEIPNGSCIDIQGLKCWIPQEGYVFNVVTKQLEYTGVYSRSEDIKEQKWERTPLPDWYKEVQKKWKAYDKKKKEDEPDFYDEQLEVYKKQEWYRRLNGFWFMNNGKPVYLTGSHYMFMQWWQIDIGYPRFRVPDLEYFYFQQYCIEDPECMGMLEITKRRFGKTFRGGLFLYEYVTRTKMTNGAIQSKTGMDAKKVFGKAVISPFKKLPKFFRPEYDASLGITPKTEIRFQQTNVRGSKAEDGLDKEELGSMIDHGSADPIHYDGQKVHRGFEDEWAKCFGKGTEIRMYNGSIKKIEDIGNDELVMGDDSTPRLTYGVRSGKEEMFKITPKKGYSWECNISHILSLKWCLNKANKKRGWGAKSVVNITVRDYLKLAPYEQKHLMLYKKPVDYKENTHSIDPYFLGLWLGDGSKWSPEITTADHEIVDYLVGIAAIEGLKISNPEHIQYRLSGHRGNKISGVVEGVGYEFNSCREASAHFGYKGNFTKTDIYKNNKWTIDTSDNNRLLSAMKGYGIIGNKHIPNEFLIDSRENRLNLLAGLVDSDGHISKGKTGKAKSIEITQKIKQLAYQINELATSLGFYSSIKTKIATMKRNDKTIYKCDVYKVMIYGDLWAIPTKIKRKQVPNINFHVNRRTAAHCGFKIESIGVGDYYGFSVGDNHLFLLKDGTVVHNTIECNIYDRHEVLRYCVQDDEGKIIGKLLYSSTVEKLDTDRDGIQESAKLLWNDSDQLNKQPNGRTASGLYRFFMTADRARNFDDYGYPDVEKTVREILADRDTVKHNPRSLTKRIKKEARTIEEAFSEDDDGCIFNQIKINEQKAYLANNPIKTFRYLHFQRRLDNQKVTWVDVDPSKTELFWKILSLPLSGDDNKSRIENGIRYPDRAENGVIGVDGYSNTQGGKEYGSKLSGWIFLKFDIMNPLNTGLFVGHIYGRPNEKDDMHNQILLAAEYFGFPVYYEFVADDYFTYFKNRGRIGYLPKFPKNAIDPIKLSKDTEGKDRHRGFPTTPFALTKQNDSMMTFVEHHCDKILYVELLDDLLKFRPFKRTPSDRTVSAMITLVSSLESVPKPPPRKTPLINIYPNMGINQQN